MSENNFDKNFDKEVKDAVAAHVERTRVEASGGSYRPSSVPEKTYVLSQFNELVETPVAASLEQSNPAAHGKTIVDYRDVQEVEKMKELKAEDGIQSIEERKARKKNKEAKVEDDVVDMVPSSDEHK